MVACVLVLLIVCAYVSDVIVVWLYAWVCLYCCLLFVRGHVLYGCHTMCMCCMCVLVCVCIWVGACAHIYACVCMHACVDG